jgi:hypothetical protein
VIGGFEMKVPLVVAGIGVLGAGLGLVGCGAQPVTVVQPPAVSSAAVPSAAGPATASRAAAPVVTKTVIKVKTVKAPPAAAPTSPAAQPVAPASPQQPAVVPNVTDPWAVVAAYYGDIESGDYQQAYALIGNGATTGQSYQDFASGFSCTGGQEVSENWESGDQVNFDLAATDSCTGAVQDFTGTDTVQNGVIVGADVVQAS